MMKRLGIGFQISLLVHGALIACFLGLQRHVAPDKLSRSIDLAILSILPAEGGSPGPSEFSGPNPGSDPPPGNSVKASGPPPREKTAAAETQQEASPLEAAPWETADNSDKTASASPEPPEPLDDPWEFTSEPADLPQEDLSASGEQEMPVRAAEPPSPQAPPKKPHLKPAKKEKPPKIAAAKIAQRNRNLHRKQKSAAPAPPTAKTRPARSGLVAGAPNHAAADTAPGSKDGAGQGSSGETTTSPIAGSGHGGGDDSGPGGSGGSGSGDQYLQAHYGAIHSRLSRCLHYPKIARKRGWSGRVLVAFTVLPDGRVDCPVVRESCGIALLDKSAIQTVQAASPFPRPGGILKIVVPVVFRLES